MRIAHPSSGEPPAMANPADGSPARIYRALEDRCRSLEESHARLREELDRLAHEKTGRNESEAATTTTSATDSDSVDVVSPEHSFPGCIAPYFSLRNPYRRVLGSLGHAVHVCRASTGEIIYWYVVMYSDGFNKFIETASFCFGSDSLVCAALACF